MWFGRKSIYQMVSLDKNLDQIGHIQTEVNN